MKEIFEAVLEYYEKEFNDDRTTEEDLAKEVKETGEIGLAYTTDEDEEHDLQVSCNPSTLDFVYYVDYIEKKRENAGDVETFCDWIRYFDFASETGACADLIEGREEEEEE